MNAKLEFRAQAMHSRCAVRAWEYRQRHHAKGVWVRLRRLLAESSRAFVIGDDAATRLIARGCAPDTVGFKLEPPKRILVVSARELDQITDLREIRVRMSAELLAATNLLLVRFD